MDLTKALMLKLSEELHKELEQEASKKGLSVSAYIRLILYERKK